MSTGNDYDRQFSRYADKKEQPAPFTEADSDRQFSRYADKKNKAQQSEKSVKPKSRALRISLLTAGCILLLLCAVLAFACIHQKTDPITLVSNLASGRIGFSRHTRGTETEPEAATEAETEPDSALNIAEELQTEAPDPEFFPYCTDATDPDRLIEYTEIEVNDTILESVSEYAPVSEISFDPGEDYTDVEGIVTFRGDNFRNSPSYGFAEMSVDTMSGVWTQSTGGLSYGNATWTGSGWTGQPLMMKWPRAVKEHMNMYEEAKSDDDLVEVIYACMDGYVYFLNLRSGEKTRDPLYLGFTFKGSGALDPRGYPILYLGAGYDSGEGTARVFVVNLLDCSVMLTFGNNDPFSLRGSLSYFDSSALVDAETDTLIYPGENGILYLMKLNTVYDEAAGTLSIAPDPVVKWRYSGVRTTVGSYWVGMETSAAVYKGYLFVADNGGNLMCLDLNTLQLVWVQDTLDDTNSTPVLAFEDGHLYLYVSTSFHLGWRSTTSATVPIWKIDAESGEIVWQTDYECYTVDGVSGGVQSTVAVGKYDLSDYLYVTVSRTGGLYDGVLACLDRSTGEIVWEHKAYYAWSSPVCVYNSDGSGRVIYCSCEGYMYLMDPLTGDVLDICQISDGSIEASPAVYEDIAVIGTRACRIMGIQLH